MMEQINNLPAYLYLGNYQDFGHEIKVDLSAWNIYALDRYAIRYVRAGETRPHPIAGEYFSVVDGILTWTISQAVTDKVGRGSIVFEGYVGNFMAVHSNPCYTAVGPGLPADEDAPTPIQDWITATTATEADRAEAETARETAEGLRETAEGLRDTAEGLRAGAETSRNTAEGLRLSAEISRNTAEGLRDDAETARKEAETLRVEAEAVRMGFKPMGAYNPANENKYGEWYTHEGGSYGYIWPEPSTGVPLSDTSHWQQIATIGGQDLVDAAVAARDAAQGYKDAAAAYAAQLAAGLLRPKGTYANLAALNAGTPTVADTNEIYITLDDGKWCYHNGTAWVAGGQFQATERPLDTTLSVSGMAADAKVTGDKVGELKSALNELSDEIGNIVAPGFYAVGEIIATSSTLLPGTTIFYDFSVNSGVSGFLEILDSNNTRLNYIGKGYVGSGDLNYSGQYTLPSNYATIKINGSQGVTIKKLYTPSMLAPTVTKHGQAIANIFDQIGNTVAPGVYAGGTNLFTSSDIPAGETIYYDITAESGKTGFIYVLDGNDGVLAYIGKTAAGSGDLHYSGKYVLPSAYAKLTTGGSGTTTIKYLCSEMSPIGNKDKIGNTLMGTMAVSLTGAVSEIVNNQFPTSFFNTLGIISNISYVNRVSRRKGSYIGECDERTGASTAAYNVAVAIPVGILTDDLFVNINADAKWSNGDSVGATIRAFVSSNFTYGTGENVPLGETFNIKEVSQRVNKSDAKLFIFYGINSSTSNTHIYQNENNTWHIDAMEFVITPVLERIDLIAPIDERLDAVEEAIGELPQKYITSWGDSLTAMGGWTEKLQSLSGMTLHNCGVGGETVETIATRQGGDAIIIQGIEIPATATAVSLNCTSFSTQLGYSGVLPRRQNGPTDPSDNMITYNPCRIDYYDFEEDKVVSIFGSLDWVSADNTYKFTRSEAGEAVVLSRPVPIITKSDIKWNSPHLMTIFMGQNSFGYDNGTTISGTISQENIEKCIRLTKAMIGHANAKNVLVFGIATGTEESNSAYEQAMEKEFGRYFISLRQYLAHPVYSGESIVSCYGLQDMGETASSADLANIVIGKVPDPCFLDESGHRIHFAVSLRPYIGRYVYERCKELNIF